MQDSEDFVDIQPWPVAELAGNLVAHVALGRRGLIESDRDADVFERETDRFELDAWARLELTSWLDTGGLDILDAPTGDLSQGQVERCNDALIIASTIAWTLRVVDDPRLPIVSDGGPEQRAIEWAPGPWTPVRNVLKRLRVRSDEELGRERERWELLHWRSTLFGEPMSIADDRQALAETVKELREHDILQTSGEDFMLDDGASFAGLDDDTLDNLAHQAELRLRALNWVCGYGDTPTSAPLFLDEGEVS